MIADRLKKLKQSQGGLTNKELAERIGVSRNTVNSWTSNKRKPSATTIKLIEKAFFLNPGWLEGADVDMLEPIDKKKKIKELMKCKTDFAVDTVYQLSEMSCEGWNALMESFDKK